MTFDLFMKTGISDAVFLFFSLDIRGDSNHGLEVGRNRLLRDLTGMECSIPKEMGLLFELEDRFSRTELGLGASKASFG